MVFALQVSLSAAALDRTLGCRSQPHSHSRSSAFDGDDEGFEAPLADVGDLRQRVLKALKEEVVEAVAHRLGVGVDPRNRRLDRSRAESAQKRDRHLRDLQEGKSGGWRGGRVGRG